MRVLEYIEKDRSSFLRLGVPRQSYDQDGRILILNECPSSVPCQTRHGPRSYLRLKDLRSFDEYFYETERETWVDRRNIYKRTDTTKTTNLNRHVRHSNTKKRNLSPWITIQSKPWVLRSPGHFLVPQRKIKGLRKGTPSQVLGQNWNVLELAMWYDGGVDWPTTKKRY